MGRPDLLEDPRFATLADRARNGDTINAIVAQWTSSQTAIEVERACVDHDVPVATAYTARDIAARPALRGAPRSRLGGRPGAGPAPPAGALSPARGRVGAGARRGPALWAQHNREVWCDVVGLSPSEFEALVAKGIV